MLVVEQVAAQLGTSSFPAGAARLDSASLSAALASIGKALREVHAEDGQAPRPGRIKELLTDTQHQLNRAFGHERRDAISESGLGGYDCYGTPVRLYRTMSLRQFETVAANGKAVASNHVPRPEDGGPARPECRVSEIEPRLMIRFFREFEHYLERQPDFGGTHAGVESTSVAGRNDLEASILRVDHLLRRKMGDRPWTPEELTSKFIAATYIELATLSAATFPHEFLDYIHRASTFAPFSPFLSASIGGLTESGLPRSMDSVRYPRICLELVVPPERYTLAAYTTPSEKEVLLKSYDLGDITRAFIDPHQTLNEVIEDSRTAVGRYITAASARIPAQSREEAWRRWAGLPTELFMPAQRPGI